MIRAFLRAPSGLAAGIGLLAILVLAIVAPVWLGEIAAKTSVVRSGEPPSAEFWLGTDMLGRSILARVLVATQLSLLLALAATAVAAVTGVGFGIGVALGGRWVRRIGLRTIDVLLGFPGILLAIVVTAVIGTGVVGAVVAVGLSFAPEFARLASSLALSVAGRDYIAAARLLGVPPARMFWRYVLPNIGETLIVSIFAAASSALIAVAALSFLGLGVQPPQFDWGRMLIEGVGAFYETPLAALAPAAMIAATGLVLGFFGEALARALNPLLWTVDIRRQAALPPVPHDAAPAVADAVLAVEDLAVTYPGARVVDGVSLELAKGEIVGVVGESGSGKSQLALAIAGLIPPQGRVSGTRRFLGHDLGRMPGPARDHLLGTRLALVFQDPMASLNPSLTVGLQVAEPGFIHGHRRRREAFRLALERLGEVGIPNPAARAARHPHEFSGGMQQRAMIAMGLMNDPALLIADEPTTALDVTVQAQVIDLLAQLNRDHGTAILLITHNIGVVAMAARRIVVMYAGRIVEDGPAPDVLGRPAHPYTRLLLAAAPTLDGPVDAPLAAIDGRPPDPADRPPGCAFAPRCPDAVARCGAAAPALAPVGDRHRAACWMAAS